MTEQEGDVIVIYTSTSEIPIIFKLDQTIMEWEEMRTLDRETPFASFLSSHLSTNIPGIMGNNIVLL